MNPRTWSRALFAVVVAALVILGACAKADEIAVLRDANKAYSDGLTDEAARLRFNVARDAFMRSVPCGTAPDAASVACRRKASADAIEAAGAELDDVNRRVALQHQIAEAIDLAAACRYEGAQECLDAALAKARALLPSSAPSASSGSSSSSPDGGGS